MEKYIDKLEGIAESLRKASPSKKEKREIVLEYLQKLAPYVILLVIVICSFCCSSEPNVPNVVINTIEMSLKY